MTGISPGLIVQQKAEGSRNSVRSLWTKRVISEWEGGFIWAHCGRRKGSVHWLEVQSKSKGVFHLIQEKWCFRRGKYYERMCTCVTRWRETL